MVSLNKRKYPWLALQQWDDLLFLHWPVPYEVLRPFVPEALELETYDGQAWVGVVPFHASKNRLRGIPYSVASFLELNIRTYVRFYDEPGVYFITLDANNKWVVAGARGLFSLPYVNARMNLTQKGKEISFKSQRYTNDGAKDFSIKYQPSSMPYYAKENTLTYWLTERYCQYVFRGNNVLKGPISHQPWKLQDAEVDIEKNRAIPYLPHTYFQQTPLAHFSKTKKARAHPFEIVGKYS